MIIKIKKLYDEGTEGMDRKGPDRGTCGEVKKRDTRSYLKIPRADKELSEKYLDRCILTFV